MLDATVSPVCTTTGSRGMLAGPYSADAAHWDAYRQHATGNTGWPQSSNAGLWRLQSLLAQ
jgi:hypothetical protein